METLELAQDDPRVGSRANGVVRWPDVMIDGRPYRKETASTMGIGGDCFIVFKGKLDTTVKLKGASPAPAGVPKSDDSPKSFGRSTPLPVKEDSEAKGV